MALIAVVDFLFSRWEFLRKMRMSKRELQDEHKHREGDPRLRKRMRELQREMSKRAQALKGVPEASVIVTNPTRVAIAIRYDSKFDQAPRLIAKGAGEMARHIRAIANRHRIPIVQSPRLARALYRQVDFDQYVPEEWHPLMARVLVWIARKNATGIGAVTR
jgi:flagellar biosynthesis protein FlhB